MRSYDVLIIGGGIAGISAAKALKDKNVLIAERKDRLGGILNQCLHRGFGKDMTGPEYTSGILSDFPGNIEVALSTTVTKLSSDKTATLSSKDKGVYTVRFSEIILATGCMERPLGHMLIEGTRPKGIYTAGQMQEMMNIHGIIPPSPAVILGSGDIGLIMAKHLLENGIELTIIEREDHLGGLLRNQLWIKEYPVKMILSNTIKKIIGEKTLEGVILTDDTFIPAKTLLTATGLIPDRELINDKDYPYEIHTCGNCREVFPMIEAVIRDATATAMNVLEKLRKQDDR